MNRGRTSAAIRQQTAKSRFSNEFQPRFGSASRSNLDVLRAGIGPEVHSGPIPARTFLVLAQRAVSTDPTARTSAQALRYGGPVVHFSSSIFKCFQYLPASCASSFQFPASCASSFQFPASSASSFQSPVSSFQLLALPVSSFQPPASRQIRQHDL